MLIDPSDMKTTKTDEPIDVTVEVLGVVQYEPIMDDDAVAPLYNLTKSQHPPEYFVSSCTSSIVTEIVYNIALRNVSVTRR